MRIVSILSKLFKTVGLLAVRLNLTELRWKKRKKNRIFDISMDMDMGDDFCHKTIKPSAIGDQLDGHEPSPLGMLVGKLFYDYLFRHKILIFRDILL